MAYLKVILREKEPIYHPQKSFFIKKPEKIPTISMMTPKFITEISAHLSATRTADISDNTKPSIVSVFLKSSLILTRNIIKPAAPRIKKEKAGKLVLTPSKRSRRVFEVSKKVTFTML